MTTAQNLPYVPPTGRWLARERRRLGLTAGEVARAVGCPPASLSVLCRQNRIVPPGWTAALWALGLRVPTAPAARTAYTGVQLRAELGRKPHLRLTPSRLSHKLAVPEAELLSLLGAEQAVPPSWLPKLAELGLEVPALDASPAVAAPRAEEATATRDTGSRPQVRFAAYGPYAPFRDPMARAPSATETEPAPQPTSMPERSRKPAKLYLHWSEEDGLHLTMSEALMELLPAALAPVCELLRSELLPSLLLGLRSPCSGADLSDAGSEVRRNPVPGER